VEIDPESQIVSRPVTLEFWCRQEDVPMRKLLVGLLLSFVAVTSTVSIAGAQDEATPAPLGAANCTVEPIDPDAYNAAIAEATPPLPQPMVAVGEPADKTTIAAVTDAIEQSVACTNIGDLGRLLAVIDPAYAPTLLGVPFADVPAAVEAAAATSNSTGPATPLVDDYDSGGLVSSLLEVTDVVVLPDGRAAAVATVQRVGMPATTFTIYLRFDEAENRYIITSYTFHPQDATPTA
jgi:hypothetical protein